METVTVTSVTTTTDDHGNSTATETAEAIPGALFAPSRVTEQAFDTRAPAVLIPATFYLPVARDLNSDDTITRADDTVWRVLGGSAVWGPGTEVPVERAASV